MWSTMDETKESIVKYFLNDDQFEAKGHSHTFVDGGESKHKQYIHKVRYDDVDWYSIRNNTAHFL